MAKLIISDGSNSTEFSISKSEIKIGRNRDKNDLVLPSQQVSIVHALLKRMGAEYLLLDLNSTNGTFVKDERVYECRLKDGDIFSIGNFTLKLVDRAIRANVSYNESPI